MFGDLAQAPERVGLDAQAVDVAPLADLDQPAVRVHLHHGQGVVGPLATVVKLDMAWKRDSCWLRKGRFRLFYVIRTCESLELCTFERGQYLLAVFPDLGLPLPCHVATLGPLALAAPPPHLDKLTGVLLQDAVGLE